MQAHRLHEGAFDAGAASLLGRLVGAMPRTGAPRFMLHPGRTMMVCEAASRASIGWGGRTPGSRDGGENLVWITGWA